MLAAHTGHYITLINTLLLAKVSLFQMQMSLVLPRAFLLLFLDITQDNTLEVINA